MYGRYRPTQQRHLLRQLYQANLFLEALDDQRDWFRFHALFRDVLLVQLQTTQPQQIPTLHRRASHWYAQDGQITPALHHALAAEDPALAADLIEQHAWDLLENGNVLVVRSWLNSLPATLIQARPWLSLLEAGVLLTTGQLTAAEQAIALLRARPDWPNKTVFAGELAHLAGVLARFQGDNPAAIRLAEEALRHLPPHHKSARAAVLLNLAIAHIATGNTAAASEALTSAGAVAASSQASHGAALGLGWLYVRQGRLAEAATLYHYTIAQMATPNPDLSTQGLLTRVWEKYCCCAANGMKRRLPSARALAC
ncbi:MAG: hypothetical protein H6652_16155 [Ardenticatenaceae bacterium]|nr:hypothetical protein [Ardenticatenaceae bacterium]